MNYEPKDRCEIRFTRYEIRATSDEYTCFGHLNYEFFTNSVKSAQFMPQVSVVSLYFVNICVNSWMKNSVESVAKKLITKNLCNLWLNSYAIRKSSTLVEYIRQINFFMQNKPNFTKNRAIISYGKTKDYKNEPPFLA